MKKYFAILYYLISFTCFFIACKEDDIEIDKKTSKKFSTEIVNYTPQKITHAPYEDQKAYASYHLSVLSQSLLGLANNNKFRNILYTKVEERNTGEYSTLFSSLFKELNSKEPFLVDKMNQEVSLKAFINSQRAFWGIEEKILFPQIFIPFFDKVAPKIHNGNLHFVKYPTIVTDPLSNQVATIGYTVDELGNIIKVSKVDEEYARNNEVWVVSLNERAEVSAKGLVINCDTYAFLCYPEYKEKKREDEEYQKVAKSNKVYNTCTSDGNPGWPKNSERGIDVYINNMAIKEHKEAWHRGASEIYISATTIWGGGVNLFTNQTDKTAYWGKLFGLDREYTVRKIEKISRADIRYERSKAIDMKIATRWGGPGDKRSDTMPFVIYEYDGWPSKTTITTTTHTAGRYNFIMKPEFNKNEYTFTVRTRNTPYYNGFFNWYQGHPFYACGHSKNSKQIAVDFYTRKPF